MDALMSLIAGIAITGWVLTVVFGIRAARAQAQRQTSLMLEICASNIIGSDPCAGQLLRDAQLLVTETDDMSTRVLIVRHLRRHAAYQAELRSKLVAELDSKV